MPSNWVFTQRIGTFLFHLIMCTLCVNKMNTKQALNTYDWVRDLKQRRLSRAVPVACASVHTVKGSETLPLLGQSHLRNMDSHAKSQDKTMKHNTTSQGSSFRRETDRQTQHWQCAGSGATERQTTIWVNM